MLPIFNLFAGGPLGSGQQWCSWIHRYGIRFCHFNVTARSDVSTLFCTNKERIPARLKCGLICRDDLVNMVTEALTNKSFKGTYNATAPNPVRMSDLCASLGRPSWLPVPDFAIQASIFAASIVTSHRMLHPMTSLPLMNSLMVSDAIVCHCRPSWGKEQAWCWMGRRFCLPEQRQRATSSDTLMLIQP